MIGRCHLCVKDGQPQPRDVDFCSLCGHWFCEACRERWWSRGLEYVKQLVGGRHPGCCGPTEQQSEVA